MGRDDSAENSQPKTGVPPQEPTAKITAQGDITVGGDFIGRDKIVIASEQAYSVVGLPSPYPGLRPFTYPDHQKFGGRASAVAEAVHKLTRPGLEKSVLFITGSSGCGKSSFAQAGLLPALEKHFADRHQQARKAVLHPSSNPMLRLQDGLAQLGLVAEARKKAIEGSPAEFYACVSENTPEDQVNVLVIDQFEECFIQSGSQERERFFLILEEFIRSSWSRTCFLITLRLDFLKDLFDFSSLYNACKEGIELRGMGREELRDAILAPLQWERRNTQQLLQKQFEPALLDALVQDACQDASYLPLLQVALQELWRGGSLTRGAYPGLTDAISRRADTFLNYVDFQADSPHQERPSQDRDEIIRVLLDLVSVPTLEDGRAPMRRQRWQDELVGNSQARRQLVAELVEARLCAVTLEPRGDQQSDAVNLIHESLLANWPYLQEQIHHEQEALLRQARFESFFNEWVSSKPDERDGYLLSGARLEDARQLLANGSIALKDPQAQEFLRTSYEKSAAEAQRRLGLEQRARRLLQALAGLLTVLLLTSWAWIAYPFLLSLLAGGELASIDDGVAVIGPDVGYGPPRGEEAQRIPLAAFQIERYEVTNLQYSLCVKARRCSEPLIPFDLSDPEKVDLPVVGVTAYQAAEYCQWIRRRLPDEIEWERAARGEEGRLWPWGDADPDPSRANLTYVSAETTQTPDFRPVKMLLDGCSPKPEQVCNLIGNASEWTSSWQPEDNDYHPGDRWDGTKNQGTFGNLLIFRGFAYDNEWDPNASPANLTSLSQAFPGNITLKSIGFRCARSAP